MHMGYVNNQLKLLQETAAVELLVRESAVTTSVALVFVSDRAVHLVSTECRRAHVLINATQARFASRSFDVEYFEAKSLCQSTSRAIGITLAHQLLRQGAPKGNHA